MSQQVITFHPRRVNHGLHLIATVFTCGFWAPVWAAVWLVDVMRGRPRIVISTEDTHAAQQAAAYERWEREHGAAWRAHQRAAGQG